MLQILRKILPGGGKPAHERRRLPPPGPCPNVGATIVRRAALIKIGEPLGPELWNWLVLAGWREVRMSRNRRRYVPLPADALRRLARCRPEERELVHQRLLAGASQ